jgi:hypothetical protein
MAIGQAKQGLTSEPLRAALRNALAGEAETLEQLFVRYGGGPDPRPNLKLAAAFGDEMEAHEDVRRGASARLLARLAAEDAAPDTPPVFLPMAAAFGWVGRLRGRHDEALAWDALRELAGDERAPVRLATHAALRDYAHVGSRAGELVARAGDWFEAEDREVRFGAAAVVVEVLSERQALACVPDLGGVFDYLSRAIADAADAPRSAERSDGRRRLLAALPRAIAAVVAAGGEEGLTWLERECADAQQPGVRAMLSDAVVRVLELGAVVGQRARAALEASAKPLRDPTRVRPGAGRGRATRRMR